MRVLNGRIALLAALAFAPLAQAQDESGMYIGAGFGTFDYDESDDIPFPVSDTTTAYQLVGGYRFNEHLAIELGVGRTGDLEAEFAEEIPGIGPVTLEIDASYDIYSLRVLGMLPFDRFTLVGGAGYYSADLGVTGRLRGLGDLGGFDGHERGATASVGLQYDFRLDLRSLSIRGEYQWFDFGSEIDAAGFNVTALFRF